MLYLILLLGALFLSTEGLEYSADALADEIKAGSLPGANGLNINFKQFSGYLDGTLIF